MKADAAVEVRLCALVWVVRFVSRCFTPGKRGPTAYWTEVCMDPSNQYGCQRDKTYLSSLL